MTAVEPTKVEISPDQTEAWIHIKDFSYGDFGRSETLQHFTVASMMENSRLAVLRGLADYPRLVNNDYDLFIIGQHYRFLPAIWAVRRGTGFPYLIHLKVVDIGQSSLTFRERLINKLDQKELASMVVKFVYVHRATGRSVPFPNWMQRKYKPTVQKEQQPLALPKSAPQVPPSAYIYDVTVADSDTDFNHSNQATYKRFCSDATHAAVKEGRLPRLEPDACDFPVMELQAVFAGESRMGDKLQVLLWQQEDCRDIIRYVIRKKDEENVIYHGHTLYGKPSPPLSHL